MKFKPATAEDDRIFAEWSQLSRIEERTCRPIFNGKRSIPSNDAIVLSFSSDTVNEVIGRFQYFDINIRNRSAEFGYTVNPKFRKQGIGSKMLATAINHLFLTTNLNKLYCQTASFNIASIKLLQKLNFHQDGILREHHELDGKLWDDYIYSILRHEWKEIADTDITRICLVDRE
jgi:[ribosomal protein S5]-alanine N-acetyltransferase